MAREGFFLEGGKLSEIPTVLISELNRLIIYLSPRQLPEFLFGCFLFEHMQPHYKLNLFSMKNTGDLFKVGKL